MFESIIRKIFGYTTHVIVPSNAKVYSCGDKLVQQLNSVERVILDRFGHSIKIIKRFRNGCPCCDKVVLRIKKIGNVWDDHDRA